MPTDLRLSVLDHVRIATPCPMRWDDMAGTDAKRFCGECRLHVYNLSTMSRIEAEALVQAHAATGERLCAGFYRRADGTILTQDCPVGMAALRRRAAAAWRRVAAAAALTVGSGLLFAFGEHRFGTTRLRGHRPFAALCEWLNPTPVSPPWMGGIVMGDVSFDPPPTPTDPGEITPGEVRIDSDPAAAGESGASPSDATD